MSQIIDKEMKGSHRRTKGVDWPDDEPQTEEEEDHIGPDGTDYVAKAYDDDETEVERKVGEKEGRMFAEGEEEEEDEDEGKEESRPLDMDKSFFDYVEENPTLLAGVEQSPFLLEMVKSIGFSFAKLEDNLGVVFAGVHNDYVDFAKGVDGTFEELGKSLGMIDTTGTSVDEYAAQGNVDLANAAPTRHSKELGIIGDTNV